MAAPNQRRQMSVLSFDVEKPEKEPTELPLTIRFIAIVDDKGQGAAVASIRKRLPKLGSPHSFGKKIGYVSKVTLQCHGSTHSGEFKAKWAIDVTYESKNPLTNGRQSKAQEAAWCSLEDAANEFDRRRLSVN
jgi:hypothetical protein